MKGPLSLRLPEPLYQRLMAHLFPGDGDEHGAMIAAGICETERGTRLLARELFLAQDGADYVPGERGYRALTARFVAEHAGYCGDEQLCYLAVHNHAGCGQVQFSNDDLASHERGYPALLDITNGGPVGALVFNQDAAAGDIWLRDGERQVVDEVVIIGRRIRYLYPAPLSSRMAVERMYDRHARLFGDLGQQRLQALKAGIIGAGGVGSLVNQQLAHLGVGHIVVIDPERVDLTNLPRVVGATRWDARAFLTNRRRLRLQQIGARFAQHKVKIAQRLARRANPSVRFEAIVGDVVDTENAARLIDADVLFLAADSMQSRRVFNALVFQYLIPGFQMGAKVVVEKTTRQVDDIFTVERPVMPYSNGGCLLCNGLILSDRLRDEAVSPAQRAAQRYVEDDEVRQPSVITLNAITASQAVNDMLLMVTGLFDATVNLDYRRYEAQSRSVQVMGIRRSDPRCLDCGQGHRSRLGRGDRARLPCRVSQ